MRTRPVCLALSGAIALGFACDSDPSTASEKPKAEAKAESEANPAPDAKTDAKPDPTSQKAGKKKRAEHKGLEKKTPDQLKKTRTDLRARLGEGRKLVKSGDLEGGVLAYNTLLRIDPHYGPALGELGWAHFKGNELELAQRYTSRALKLARDDKRRGMLLYNLGRVAEARDDKAAASDHYTRSLSVRPNATVEKRLAGLTSAGIRPPTTAVRNGLPLLSPTPFTSIESACEFLKNESMCPTDTCELAAAPSEGPEAGGMLLVDDWAESCWHPAIRGAGGWWIFASALYRQYGSEIDQNVDKLSTAAMTAGTTTTVTFRFEDHVYEREWSMGDLEDGDELPGDDSTDSEGLVICRSTDAGVSCTRPIVSKLRRLSGDGESGPNYTAKLVVQDDSLIVSDVVTSGSVDYLNPGDEWGSTYVLRAGSYPLDSLSTPDAPGAGG